MIHAVIIKPVIMHMTSGSMLAIDTWLTRCSAVQGAPYTTVVGRGIFDIISTESGTAVGIVYSREEKAHGPDKQRAAN